MRLLILRTASQHNVLSRMAEQLHAAFLALGLDAGLLHLATADPSACLAALEARFGEARPDHVIAFGSFTADFAADLYARHGVSFVGWDVDHPAYQFARFAAPLSARLQVCASDSHVRFRRRMGGPGEALLMTPGVDAVAEAPVPLASREIPLMAAVSWIGEPEVWWARFKGKPVHDLVEGMVERLLADDAVDLLRAFDAVTRDRGIDLPIDRNVANIFANVGLFIRRHDRLRLMQALAALDTPCVLHGDGWEGRLGPARHITFAGSLDYADCAQAYGRARAVLNLNAANGASERAVMALAAGAVVVSDFSPLLADAFGGRGMVFHRRGVPDALGQALAALEGSTAQDLADAGHAGVAEAHTWRSKAAQLVETLAAERLAA